MPINEYRRGRILKGPEVISGGKVGPPPRHPVGAIAIIEGWGVSPY